MVVLSACVVQPGVNGMNPFFGKPHERKPEQLVFHVQRPEEFNGSPQTNSSIIQMLGLNPQHRDYRCGACGSNTSGRVLCDVTRPSDGAKVQWCLCACDRMEPSVFVHKDGDDLTQLPMPRMFVSESNWPPDLAKLYDEAAMSFSAGAHTGTAMLCRKILMATACHEGDDDGKKFVQYVDYIINKVFTFPKAKAAIERIKDIGNEANHKLDFVSPDDAKRAMQIVTYMLNTIYSLPAA